MPSILVISNCQTYGLANCLKLAGVDVRADGCDIDRFQRESDFWLEKLQEYDHLFVAPEAKDKIPLNFMEIENVTWIPTVYFSAFHGDLTYATSNGALVKTPADAYNSKLILGGYTNGLTEKQTKNLFDLETYRRVGYLELYEQSKIELIERYDQYGLDIRNCFYSWMREGVFMHSVNHPKIQVLYDIAIVSLQKIGLSVRHHDFRPHDNLANGPAFPIYPEIAKFYGFPEGANFYKSAYDYITYDLCEFIGASYEAYRQFDASSIVYSEFAGSKKDAFLEIIEECRK